MWESVQEEQHFVDSFVDPQWYKTLSLQVTIYFWKLFSSNVTNDFV